ncbi:MAG TPA: type II toxin-antitoxin system VapC family toxin [Rhizomicrobium sp.]
MTPILVDSNVLLDVIQSSDWSEWSASALSEAAESAQLLINVMIYAEISTRFETKEAVDWAIPSSIGREPIPDAAGFLAGKVFQRYGRAGGVRSSPLPDFFIGAHAAIAGYRLLTRDTKRYRTYFPRLELIAPDS